MSKTKTKSGPQGVKGAKAGVLTKVKGSAVTKPSETVKAKSKEIAKEVAKKAGKEEKKKKKIVKVPTPEPESASEEEEESDTEASDDSDSENESDSEVETPALKVKANGARTSKKDDSSDESDSDSESEESASEDETLPTKTNGTNKKKAEPETDSDADSEDDSEDDGVGAAKTSAKIEDSEDDSESDSDESESDEEVAKAETSATKGSSKAETASSDEEESDDSDDSDESDESDADQEAKNQASVTGAAKRKADEESPFAAKKAKVDAADPGKGPNLFIGNLSWNVDEEWLRSEFESFGEISGVRLMVDRATGRSKGYGYVEFVNAADAAKAHETKQGAELDGRAMNVDFANARTGGGERQDNRRKSYGDQVGEPSDTLFVGNLSFNSTQDSLTEAFASHGTIQSIRLPTDRETGAPKGFGWITFASQEEASAALTAMQGAYVDSRPIRLDYGTPKPQGDSPARGGFGGRGRGGFNGGRGRGGFGDRGRGAPRGGRGRGGFSTNRGGFGDFSGRKTTF